MFKLIGAEVQRPATRYQLSSETRNRALQTAETIVNLRQHRLVPQASGWNLESREEFVQMPA
jgi:hypothetical protein